MPSHRAGPSGSVVGLWQEAYPSRAWAERPAIARGAILQKGYEPRVLLVFRGATGDRLVGQVGGAEGIYQSLRVGYSGRSEERHFGRLGDREIPIERSKTVPPGMKDR